MKNGEGVPDTALWGMMAGNLPEQELHSYRVASVDAWRTTYGHEAESAMVSRYGSVVRSYFTSLEVAAE